MRDGGRQRGRKGESEEGTEEEREEGRDAGRQRGRKMKEEGSRKKRWRRMRMVEQEKEEIRTHEETKRSLRVLLFQFFCSI